MGRFRYSFIESNRTAGTGGQVELPKDFGGLGVVVPGLVDGHLGCKYSL
jgi:hypothetical protein